MKKMVSKSTHISLSIVLYVYLMSLYFQFCVLHFLSKIRKLIMIPICGEEKAFEKLEGSLFRYPVGRKFRRNLTRLRKYKQFCVLLIKKINA